MLNALRNFGLAISRFTGEWVPDSWIICLILTGLSMLLAILGVGVSLEDAVLAWGGGVWVLLELAMQFTLALIAANACVSARPVHRFLDRLAGLPDPEHPAQAIALAAAIAVLVGYLNWAVSVVGCALFATFIARRNPKVDVRVLAVTTILGMGTVWHGGFSGSAPLIMATPGNPLIDPSTGAAVVDRLYPVTETLLHPFNLVYMALIGSAGVLAAVAVHPKRDPVTFSEAHIEAILPRLPEEEPLGGASIARLESSRLWIWFAAALLAYPLGHALVTRGFGATWTINAYNTAFLALALLLHGRPQSFLAACREGVGPAWGIILQFPFYAGIFGLMQGTGLGAWMGELFARVATQGSYPIIVFLYSGLVNLFVPSAGSKWLIEAPYLIPAAEQLDVSVTTVLLAYAYGDSSTNLIQPLIAIPVLAVLRIRFGEIAGYGAMIMAICLAVSLVAMWLIPSNL